MASPILAVEDLLTCGVCLFLSPPEWCELRASHHRLRRRLQAADVQWLFGRQLQGRLAAAPSSGLAVALGRFERSPGSSSADGLTAEISSLGAVACLAANVETVVEVVQDIVAHPRLIGPEYTPVREAVVKLHRLALHDCQLRPRERTGRRSSLSKRLLRSFASLSGLLPCLVAMLRVFPPGALPPDVFIMMCEVLASLIHNSKDAKRQFIAAGGLSALLAFLRMHKGDRQVQAGGLAALLALSARSVSCIQFMVEAETHEVVATALRSFPSDSNVVTRATGLLANMSNVPCVCPVLQRCGVFALARDLLLKQTPVGGEAASPFLREFARYLLANLGDGGSH